MAITINIQPTELLVLSGNPLIFQVQTDTTGKTYHYLCARVREVAFMGDIEVGVEKMPIVNGMAEFDLAAYVRVNYRGHYHVETSNLFNLADILKKYKVEFFEIYDNDGIEYPSPHEYSNEFYVLQGKITDIDYQLLNIKGYNFYSYFIEYKKRFLTYQPGKYTQTGSLERLYFFINYSTAQDVSLCVAIEYTDGTTATQVINTESLAAYSVYEIKTGFTDLGLSTYESSTKIVAKYQVYLTNNGSTISELFTYYLDRRNYTQVRSFCFLNSLGVYDFVSMHGFSEEEINIDRETGYFLAKKKVTDISYATACSSTFGWLNTAFFDARMALKYVSDFVISKDAREIFNLVSVNITFITKKFNTSRDNSFLPDVVIEYERPQDSAYSDFIFDETLNLDINLPLVVASLGIYINYGNGLIKWK